MDEQNNNNEAVTMGDQPSAADSSEPSYITADQLHSTLKETTADIKRVVASMLKTQPPAPASQSAKAETKAAVSSSETQNIDVAGLMKREREIIRSIHRSGFNEAQEDLIRGMVEANSPEDVGAFIADMAAKFGVGAANSNNNETKRIANPTPSSDGGLPAMTNSVQSDDVPIWEWPQEKVDRFIAEKGPAAFRRLAKSRVARDGKNKRLSTLHER